MAVDETINQLYIQLRKVGYNEYQIRQMTSEVIGNKKVASLTPDETQALIDHLVYQLTFARKCLDKDLAVGSDV